MIEKMKFVNIMGHIDDIERVKEEYLSSCDIQIEDAVYELGSSQNVSSFVVVNNYIDHLRKAEQFAGLGNIECAESTDLTKDQAIQIVDEIDEILRKESAEISEHIVEKQHYADLIDQVSPFIDLEFPIDKLLRFHFIKYRFGKIPINSYKQFETYMFDHGEIIFEKSSMDKDFVYCIYFVPEPLYEKVDAIFSSLHFSPIQISNELTGTPYQMYTSLKEKIAQCDDKIADLEADQARQLQNHANDLSLALRKLKELSSFKDMQKFAAKTKDDFYVIVGWMSERDAKKLMAETDDDENIVVILEEDSPAIKTTPPTKLRNLGVFKPFETFIRMYGLPQYDEIDPTAFFALTYTILFGMMFGDFGQGIVLMAVGLFAFFMYKMSFGPILAIIGASSAVFGLMYGSVFGYENIITPIWVSPMHDITTVLITTVSFGVILNVVAMIIHIINGIKHKDWGSVFFDQNGLSGLVFYTVVLAAAVFAFLGKYSITAWIAIIFIGIPLVLIMFREPLSNLLVHKKLISGKTSDFVMELFFETFEILLSYCTNTISFVRVGAFALCHAGMMSVVLMLAGASETSMGNPIIMIVGNLFVMLMEGLVVGIQALRLQYYEMFSRYFKGGGREFVSFKKQNDL